MVSLKRTAAVIAAGALILLLPAILNGFPFVFFSDTADYLILTPRVYRSPVYQAFVLLTGWHLWIWLPIIAQALIASGTIRLFLALRGVGSAARFLGAMAMLGIGSGLSIYAGFLMPDMFTGIMFLALFMLIFDWERLSWAGRGFAFVLCGLAIGVHLSHLVMAAGMVLVGAAWRGIASRRLGSLRGAGAAGLAVIGVAGAFVGYNAIVFHTPRLSAAGSVFLMANLIEYGPVRAELATTCPQAGYRLCAHSDRLPATATDFLWRDGTFSELGGFGALDEESGRIVRATLAHRPREVAEVSIVNFGRALFRVRPARDVEATENIGLIQSVIATVFGTRAGASFRAGLQARNRFPGAPFDALALTGLIASLVLLPVLIARRRHQADRTALIFPGFVAIAYVGNAALCATVSGVFDRYQARMAWLIVLAALVLALQAWTTHQARATGKRAVRDRSGRAEQHVAA